MPKVFKEVLTMAYVTPLYPEGMSDVFLPAFEQASAFWSNVIEGGLPPKTFPNGFNTLFTQCFTNYQFEAGETLNGLGILASVVPIDGTGNVLGSAGPCSYENGFPRFGVMRFDSADSLGLANSGQFYDVVVHEMGHVIGIGTTWSRLGLVSSPCSNFLPTCLTTPTYNGIEGLEGYKALGGTGDLLVADERGPGTWNGHWKEDFFQTELMTGFLNSGVPNPISIMTILSLVDLDYKVNLDAQEPYDIPAQQRDVDEELIVLQGDILTFGDGEVDFLESLALYENGLEASEENSTQAQFTGILAMLVIGFAAMFFLVSYQAKKQRESFFRMINSNQEHTRVIGTGTKNPMMAPEIEP